MESSDLVGAIISYYRRFPSLRGPPIACFGRRRPTWSGRKRRLPRWRLGGQFTLRVHFILTHLPGPNQGPITNEPAPPNAPESAQGRLARAFMHLVDQIRTLPETEFKVYAALTGLFTLEQGRKGKISARDLATATNLSVRTIHYAVPNLEARKLIRTETGKGPKARTITLTGQRTEKITGAEFAPVAEENVAEIHKWRVQTLHHYGATGANDAPVGELFPQKSSANSAPLNQATGAPFAPVNTDEGGHAGARVSTDFDFDQNLIDQGEKPDFVTQLLTARGSDFDSRVIEEARKAVTGYQRSKLARPENRNIPPPTDDLVAQILTACEGNLSRLQRLIEDLAADRVPAGYSYGWYRTIALEKIHSIEPKVLRQRSRELSEVKAKQRTEAQLPLEGPGFRDELLRDIVRTRRAKGANR